MMTGRVTSDATPKQTNDLTARLRYQAAELDPSVHTDAMREAADTIEELTAQRALLREAVENEGPVSAYHRNIMARHRVEWPTLWVAIDRLIRSRSV